MKITLAYPMKINGRNRKADATVTVDYNLGASLIHRGLARKAEPKKAKSEPKQAVEMQAPAETDDTNLERNDLNGEE